MSAASEKRLFERIVRHYSNGTMACSRCGRTDNLSVDHTVARVFTSGNDPGKDVGRPLWRRLEREGFPDGYSVLCRVCNSAKWGSDLREIWAAHTGPPVRKGRPRVREFSREVIDFKIRFEAETGVRLPMAGRHDSSGRVRPGWVTSLRAFHRIAFFDGEENAVLGRVRPGLEGYCYEDLGRGQESWEAMQEGRQRCRRCGAIYGTSPVGPSEKTLQAMRTHRCVRWLRQEVAVTRLASADPLWKCRLLSFLR